MGKYGPRLPLSHINSKLLGTVGNYCVIAYSTPSFSKPLPAVSGEFGHEAADRQCFRSLFNMQTGLSPSGTGGKSYRFYSSVVASSFRRVFGTRRAMAEEAEASKAAPAADEETAASLRKHRRLSLLQGKISKVSRAARMAGGSLHAGDANAARRKTSTSFVAKFKDEMSAKELVIPWAHGKDLEQLKQMVMKEFDHAEVSLLDSETGSHTAPPHAPPAAPPHPSARPTTSQVNLLDAETGSLVDDEASLRLVCGTASNPRLADPRQVCYSHARASPRTDGGGLEGARGRTEA